MISRRKIKKFYKRFDVDKKKFWGSYVIKRPVFIVSFVGVLIFLLLALMMSPSRIIYVECPLGSQTINDGVYVDGCENPLYKKCHQDVVPCDQEYLTPNSVYGEKVELPFIVKNFFVCCLGLISLGFLYNHVKYNRGKKNVINK